MTIKSARTMAFAGLLGAAGVVVFAPSPAHAVAGNVQLDTGVLVINLDTTGDTVYFTEVGINVRVVADKGLTLFNGGPCSQLTFGVQCPKAAVEAFEFTGSNASDTIYANGTDVPGEFFLGSGADTMRPGHGAEFIHGEGGFDTIDYISRDNDLAVSLNGVADDGEAGEEDFVDDDIERVFGGSGNDVFTGDAGTQQFYGGYGDDILYGSVGADDTLSGDGGFDAVIYDVPASVPLAISLLDNTAKVGNAGPQSDSVFGLEMVVGGAGGDVITGDDDNNWLVGGGGTDVISGLYGDDVLYNDGALSTLDGGPGDDQLRAYQGVKKLLIGGDGEDTVDYSGYVEWDLSYEDYSGQAVKVDLDGAADDGYPGQKDKVAKDVENIAGTHFGGDELKGSSADNELYGYGGDDSLAGGGGNDLLAPQPVLLGPADHDLVNGGGGHDLVTYADGPEGIVLTLDNDANDGPAGDLDNVRSNVEDVQGSAGDDDVSGSRAANMLYGGDGADDLAGLGGNDLLDGQADGDDLSGGTGKDVVTYEDRVTELLVSLDDVVGDGEAGEDDNVGSDIEIIFGGYGEDVLIGNDGVNTIYGGGSADTLVGLGGKDLLYGDDGDDAFYGFTGLDGADKFFGGNGQDIADYRDRTGDVIVTIDGDNDDGEAGEKDTVSLDVESVIGGDGQNTLTGSDGPNTLMGGTGPDILNGLGGDDALYGFGGNDVLDGGDGAGDFADGGSGGTDTCSNAETVVSCEQLL
ncbi:calcium-binding protein [Nocardioides humilatus]|uniref:Calcium-binding protein n=1 Tax=Nocardioides humilatus TaxID=2607660 RepID=A0A5B1LG14_9ACTN|nr:calcium-binding protein [Nocardioides humilatus]KAA1419612.1 calcium-binding protein [Nocardioides humilatus]